MMSLVNCKILPLLLSFAAMEMVFSESTIVRDSTCGPPTPPYGSIIIHPPNQGNHNNGSVVLFGCKQGFFLVGPPLIKCTGNTWTEIKFRCLGSCPAFRHILNGKVIHVSPKFGEAAVEFRCNENYRLIGRTRLECISGRWDGKLPFCIKWKSCERLQVPANGTMHGNDTTDGAKISFSCLTGFDIFGLRTLICNNGQWSGSVPSCKAYCMRIRNPSNGRRFGTRYSHGNMVSFECQPGYSLVGDRVLRCIHGKWNSAVPVCNVMLCPKPAIPNNSYIIYPETQQDTYLHGTKLFLACRDGHYLTGSPIIECKQTVWTRMDFSCIASCPVFGSIKNGIITHVTLKGGGEVEIKCHTNYTLVGSPKLICTNGIWNDSLPTCGVVSCGDPGTPLHGQKKKNPSFTYGGIVRFKCDKDYILRGKPKLRCQANKKWNGVLPRCLAPCDEPATPAHGWKTNRDYRHGRSVRFYCSGRYGRVGVSSIKCNDGVWDNQIPSCKDYSPCGESPVDFRARIVGGRESTKGWWPWQIGLYKVKNKGEFQLICGGAMVSRLWVLTAAHCFYIDNPFTGKRTFDGNPLRYQIKAGDHQLDKPENMEQKIVPERIFDHPEYDKKAFLNDIALVKLGKKVKLGPSVRTLCLPKNEEGDLAIPGKHGYATGWGATKALKRGEKPAKDDQVSNALKHSSFTIQMDSLCSNATRYTFQPEVSFCAGDGRGGNDTCQGDSGGAFVREGRREDGYRWVATGIVSWGEGCAQKNRYGYFTRVYTYIDWIKKTMKEN